MVWCIVNETGLTWSQSDDTFTLHALPPMHCSNILETVSANAMYHSDMSAFDISTGGGGGGGFDDMCADDFDYNMDCGDFIF